MDSHKIFLIFGVIAAIFPGSTVFAKEIIVGDDAGWTLGFDYRAWAQGKKFYVGDKLVLQHTPGAHSVLEVNGTAFQNCTKTPSEALTSGNDNHFGNSWEKMVHLWCRGTLRKWTKACNNRHHSCSKQCSKKQRSFSSMAACGDYTSIATKETRVMQLAFAMVAVIITMTMVYY